MTVHVKKWGNSASVRIPAHVLAAAKLKIDDAVEVREEDGRIVIVAVPKPPTEEELFLRGMSANLAEEWLSPEDMEAWRDL